MLDIVSRWAELTTLEELDFVDALLGLNPRFYTTHTLSRCFMNEWEQCLEWRLDYSRSLSNVLECSQEWDALQMDKMGSSEPVHQWSTHIGLYRAPRLQSKEKSNVRRTEWNDTWTWQLVSINVKLPAMKFILSLLSIWASLSDRKTTD